MSSGNPLEPPILPGGTPGPFGQPVSSAPPPTQATGAWHHLLRATFRTLPDSLARSQQLRAATLRQLRR